jgi:hypothetical protein
MTIKLKTSDGEGGSEWKPVSQIKLKVGGAWKNVSAGYLKVAGSWKIFFGTDTINAPSIAQKVTLSQTTNSGLITLTGTNYYWTNASSLSYVFQRSSNGGASWDPISSGTATNPSSGSSNTETYQLQDNKSDVYPNVDNLYRFVVTATSAGGSTTPSTSDNQSVSAARDISNLSVVSADTTYNSVKLQFTAGAYSSSYFVRYTYSGIEEGYFRSTGSGSPTTTITVTGLSANTSYTFYVTPYTGGIASGLNTGYGGNESSSVSATTSAVLTPVQTSSPSLSGTGVAFTSITASSGTYQLGGYATTPTTNIVYYLSPYTAPTDGEVSSSATIMNTIGPPTYPITQDDATTPNKKFYARDAVTSSNGAVTYYYYSPVVTARVGTVTDNFNRTVASGLGTSSSSYIYSDVVHGPDQDMHAPSSWSTNGSVAVNSTSLTPYTSFPSSPGSAAVEYPIKALELTSKTDLTASVEIPSGGGGPGIVFWMSGAGSFYAVAPSYYQTSSSENVTSTNCNGPAITTNSNGTIPNCYGCSVTTSTSGGTSSDCNSGAFYTNSNGTSPNCYGCPVTTIPATTSSDCNFPVDKATDASGTGCFGCTVSTVSGSTSYSCGSGTTYNYPNYFQAQSACPSSCTISDTSYQDGPFTSTTYGCTGTTQNYSTLAACNASPTTSTYNASTVGTRCGACVQPIGGVNLFRAPAVAATNTTYYTTVTQFSCTYSTVTTPTTYTCRGRDTSTPVAYTCTGRDTSTPVVTSYSCTGQQVTNSVTTNTYYTQLRIMSTGYTSYVAVLKDQNINTNTSAFQKVYKVSVTTSGNNISATAYSDLSGTVLGTASYDRVDGTDLAKPATGASSYAGVIKTPSAINSGSVNNNAGSTYDNLSIT